MEYSDLDFLVTSKYWLLMRIVRFQVGYNGILYIRCCIFGKNIFCIIQCIMKIELVWISLEVKSSSLKIRQFI